MWGSANTRGLTSDLGDHGYGFMVVAIYLVYVVLVPPDEWIWKKYPSASCIHPLLIGPSLYFSLNT